jgi:acetyl esterase/lipase
VKEAQAVIDTLIAEGLAEPGRICVSGTSRGGYSALRLMAADTRIAGVAAYSPVTDWRVLREFARITDRPEVAALALTNFAESLAGRRVWIAIGNSDRRVGTGDCVTFAKALFDREAELDRTTSPISFHVVPELGHGLSDNWRQAGARYLLDGLDLPDRT